MIVCGIFGCTDSGKTTLLQNLTGKKLNKYALEAKKEITLKTGYLEYSREKYNLYFLDLPGHVSLSSQTLRNSDLLDFALYVIDSQVIVDPSRLKSMMSHYLFYCSIFEFYKIPYGVVLNKVDLVSEEEIKKLYTQITKSKTYESFILPSSAINKATLDLLKVNLDQKIEPLVDLLGNKKRSDLGLARVIKSFDLNYPGIVLKKVIGGTLGVYFYKDMNKLDLTQTFYLNEYYSKRFEEIKIDELKAPNEKDLKIGSISTYSDPAFYKNDQKKGCFLLTKEDLAKVHHLEKFNIDLHKKWGIPVKGEEVLLIYNGQFFYALVKKINKNTLELTKKNVPLNPLYTGPSETILLAQKKDHTKALYPIGLGTLYL